ncbi:hypothetical protein RF11_02475 [Thelohanellus kitauei]|uniref:Uncharacterized protein n=1 Tax=Thelohanellus kitauei TaxID=669202 RepID=A0A0C2IXZ6_THEKT|nr:hypothetical protein RF11_02475 [Thelohanellus kitauei]
MLVLELTGVHYLKFSIIKNVGVFELSESTFKANLFNSLMPGNYPCKLSNEIEIVVPQLIWATALFFFFCSQLKVFKPAPMHFCTDFTSTANTTVSTYGRVVLRLGTFLQAVKVVQDSHLLNTHPHPQPTRATLPSLHSFTGKYWATALLESKKSFQRPLF